MEQVLAAPVDLTPKKRKKRFCFATIPLIFVALLSVLESLWPLQEILQYGLPENPEYILGYFFEYCLPFLGWVAVFVGAVAMAVLLFAKVSNAWLTVPVVLISVGYFALLIKILRHPIAAALSSLEYFFDFDFAIYELLNYLLFSAFPVIIGGLQIAAFLAVIIYIFVVTKRKKPAPKVLWIIPAIIFTTFMTTSQILFLIGRIFFAEIFFTYYDYYYGPSDFLTVGFLSVAVVLLLAWLSFLYKKDKSAKMVQPETVKTETVAAEVKVEEKPIEEPVGRPVSVPVRVRVQQPKPEGKPVHEQTHEPMPEPEPAPQPPVKVEEEPKPLHQPATNKPNPYIENQETVLKLIKDYKLLLDDGTITQEEFEKKKNELLGY